MNRPSQFVCCAIVATALLGTASQAGAADSKYYHASGCAPYGATTSWSDLSVRANGLKNISTNAEYVVCSVGVDSSADEWSIIDSTTAKLQVDFHGFAGDVTRCELYIGSNLNGLPVSYTMQETRLLDGPYALQFLEIFGNSQTSHTSWPSVSLFCRVPPSGSLLSFFVRENSNTTID